MDRLLNEIDPEPEWKEAASEIAESKRIRTVYILGVPASGKTSLSLYLYDTLLDRDRAAYLDCDCGQSTAAVPLTVALRTSRFPFSIPKLLTGEGITSKFVGSTSPVKHLLQSADGIIRLHREALALGVEKIIVDSSGFVTGAMAAEFQFNIIDMLDPDMILALIPENGGCLDSILSNFDSSSPIVRRLSVSSSSRERSREERRRYREGRLTEYFATSRNVEVDLARLGLHGFVPAPEQDDRVYRGQVTGILDGERFLLALGILRSWDPAKKRTTLRIPDEALSAVERTASLQFGLMQLNTDGTEKEEF